jgi:hypothetical protein
MHAHPQTRAQTRNYIMLIAFPRQQYFRKITSFLRYSLNCLFHFITMKRKAFEDNIALEASS